MDEINKLIADKCDALKEQLIKKNIDYNNSLQNPISIFHKGNKIEGILARIDDKLNRIKQVGITDKTEDTLSDLIGYIIHLQIALELQKDSGNSHDNFSQMYQFCS
jgi:hypothetical protein